MSHPIVYNSQVSGLTLTAHLHDATGLVDSIAMTEAPTSSGRYILSAATIAGESLVAGDYDFRVEDADGVLYADGILGWDGAAESDLATITATAVRTELTVELDEVGAILEDTQTTIPALMQSIFTDTLMPLSANITEVLADTGTTLPASIALVAQKTDLPTNFADLAINASGHIERVVLTDTATSVGDEPDVLTSGAVNDASATTTSFTASGLSRDAADYTGHLLVFTSGNLQGIWATVKQTSTGTTIQLKSPLPAAPANTDTFVIGGRA